MTKLSTGYEAYLDQMRRIADLKGAMSLLHWDQETYMPEKAAPFRSRQLATLAGLSHQFATDPSLERLVNELLSGDLELTSGQRMNLEETLREIRKSKKLSQAFIEKITETQSRAFQAWQEARKRREYQIFAPLLREMISLKREQCEVIGYEESPYNALLDDYERGMKVRQVKEIFQEVGQELVPFIRGILLQRKPKNDFFHGNFPHQKQWDFGIALLKSMHFDFRAGRQDLAAHPFSAGVSPHDIRLTTRINETDLSEMIWSCIHEGGHGLYEQGLRSEEYGLPSGEAVSYAIHESQSRLWENHVGRSEDFWTFHFPRLQATFPESLHHVSLQDFYRGMNRVEASYIRTSADELTYHLHVLLRFEIELALFEGEIEVEDLPSLWNSKMKSFLGLEVPDDSQGVLQDVHWSHGSFGYFPTYSLGSFYAAQFYAQAEKELPELSAQLRIGECLPLRRWLEEKIHRHGKYYSSSDLSREVTGETLSLKPFMNYARKKYGAIYSVG
jgi:carboxypeptidase Taq